MFPVTETPAEGLVCSWRVFASPLQRPFIFFVLEKMTTEALQSKLQCAEALNFETPPASQSHSTEALVLAHSTASLSENGENKTNASHKRTFDDADLQELETIAADDGSTRAEKRSCLRASFFKIEDAPEAAANSCDPHSRFEPLVRTSKELVMHCELLSRSTAYSQTLTKMPSSPLGSGTYAAVFKTAPTFIEHAAPFAVKCVRSHERLSFQQFVEDREDQLTLSLEQNMSEFFTRFVLQPHNPAASICPNFVASMLFEQNNKRLSLVGDRCYLRYDCIVNSITFSELCDRGMVLRVSPDLKTPHQILEKIICDPVQLVSFIAQVLMGIVTATHCGVIHNDLNLQNIFEKTVPLDSVLCYQLPTEDLKKNEFPGGIIPLRTLGSLFCIGDLGLAHCRSWSKYDPRIMAAGSLHEYYHAVVSEDDEEEQSQTATKHDPDKKKPVIRKVVPANMLMLAEEDNNMWQYPLLYAGVGDFERDTASFLSHVVALLRIAKKHRVASCRSYLMATLRQLELQRPANATEFLHFVHSVLKPSFVTRTLGKQVVDKLYQFDQKATKHLHRYCLPSAAQGAELEEQLFVMLERQIEIPSFWNALESEPRFMDK